MGLKAGVSLALLGCEEESEGVDKADQSINHSIKTGRREIEEVLQGPK